MNITLINVSIETKPTKTGKSYQQADVAFKNNTFGGKVEGKKLMSFGAQAEAFKAIAAAQPGDILDITVSKNEQGYNDWVAVSKASAGAVAPPAGTKDSRGAPAPAAGRIGYIPETPEERAKKQVYIVRQSSVSSAIAALSVGAKAKLTSAEVIAEARKYEEYVFNLGGSTGFDDMPALDPSFGAEPQID
jgi:hypothetical protein